MSESFLHLSSVEQAGILSGLALQLSRSPSLLEKDVWLCWTLQKLFAMPNRVPMAFKGGTSLSKVFNAISRFSEDVDITLDYRALDDSINPLSDDVSNTRIKRFSEELKGFVQDHVHNQVTPYLRESVETEFGKNNFSIEVSDNGELLRVHYPTVLETTGEYVKENVHIEFGGRNITEPNETHPR